MRSFHPVTAILCLSQLLISQVAAHGFPSSLVVNGQTYPGSNGPSASSDSPIRKVLSGDPVTSVTSDALICGTDAQLASKSASAAPGDQLQIYWSAEGGGNWFHNAGPIMSYMAKCSGDCSSYTPDDSTEWFKIDEQGETDGKWAQANLNSGAPANVTVPKGLAAGNYLLRHEIIALQNAQTEGGTEYYPGCIQMTITGDSTGTPDTTVHFPGAYSATDPGILGNFYNPGVVYEFPGGPVANISGSGSSDSDSSSVSSNPGSSATSTSASLEGTASATATSSSPASTTSASSVTCSVTKKNKLRLKKSKAKRSETRVAEVLERHAIDLHSKRRFSRHY